MQIKVRGRDGTHNEMSSDSTPKRFSHFSSILNAGIYTYRVVAFRRINLR